MAIITSSNKDVFSLIFNALRMKTDVKMLLCPKPKIFLHLSFETILPLVRSFLLCGIAILQVMASLQIPLDSSFPDDLTLFLSVLYGIC